MPLIYFQDELAVTGGGSMGSGGREEQICVSGTGETG